MAQESLNLPYVMLSGTVLLAIIVTFLVYKPQVDRPQAAGQETDIVAVKLGERQQFLDSIDQKSAQLRANATAEQELNVVLPTDESFDDVLRLIDRQAAAAGVGVKGIDNTGVSTQASQRVAEALGQETTTPAGLSVHGVDIKLQGSYQQIRQFMSLLENAVRFMDMSELTLNQSADNSATLDGTLSIQFYSLPAPH